MIRIHADFFYRFFCSLMRYRYKEWSIADSQYLHISIYTVITDQYQVHTQIILVQL